jgi:hypothetical protein
MTALQEYARLESGGLWRPAPDIARRDVVVSFGEATLVIADGAGRALSHWSLPAIERLATGPEGATYAPGPDAGETLDLSDPSMIAAIEKVRRALARGQARPHRLRLILTGAMAIALTAGAVFWLPGALTRQALTVVPAVKQTEIGATLLGHIQAVTGPNCRGALGTEALGRLSDRLFGAGLVQIVVVPALTQGPLALPGAIIILPQPLLAEATEPAVIAGHILAAITGPEPLGRMLDQLGTMTTLGLLTTGDVATDRLQGYARDILAADRIPTDPTPLIALAAVAGVPLTPYAYSLDPTGETVLALIEADGLLPDPVPEVMSDGDWVSLQGICTD